MSVPERQLLGQSGFADFQVRSNVRQLGYIGRTFFVTTRVKLLR